jgi:hypothetical protein
MALAPVQKKWCKSLGLTVALRNFILMDQTQNDDPQNYQPFTLNGNWIKKTLLWHISCLITRHVAPPTCRRVRA